MARADQKTLLTNGRIANESLEVAFSQFRVLWPTHAQAAQTHYMNADVTLLASGVVLQTVIYKGLYGIDRFFLKEIKMLCF